MDFAITLTGLDRASGVVTVLIKHIPPKEPKVKLAPLLEGGGHERGFRSGTLNVPGIVGVGAASEIAMREMAEESLRLTSLRERLERLLFAGDPTARLNGHPTARLPHISNISFSDVDGDLLIPRLDDIAVSTASACSSGGMESSYVLRSMGIPEGLAHATIRSKGAGHGKAGQ